MLDVCNKTLMMKVYRLCESADAGYTSAFSIYMGQDRGNISTSMRAVTGFLMHIQFFEKGYNMYLDNWYTSSILFHYL